MHGWNKFSVDTWFNAYNYVKQRYSFLEALQDLASSVLEDSR